MAFNREQFIADLEAMTVLELKELVTALEEHFGVTAAAPVAVAVAGGRVPAILLPYIRRQGVMQKVIWCIRRMMWAMNQWVVKPALNMVIPMFILSLT